MLDLTTNNLETLVIDLNDLLLSQMLILSTQDMDTI